MSIDQKLEELMILKEQFASKVTPELRAQVGAKKDELINLIKEL